MKKINIKQKYKIIEKLSTNMKKDHVSECSAECSYYTILSFIPFIILLITLIQYTSIAPQTLFDAISKLIPSSMNEMVLGIVQEVYSKSIGTISISAIFLLWSAEKGFFALCKGLHNIYETERKYNYFYMQLKSLICTVIFIILIILVLTISVFGGTILEFVQWKFNISSQIIGVINMSKTVIYIVLFLALLLMYRFIPGHKKGLKKQIPGAIVATLGWFVISFFFSIYIDMFKGFSVMYGSLTTITLAMMWVYFCMYIILIGAEINNFSGERIKIRVTIYVFRINY